MGEVAKHYGWRHTLELIVNGTKGMNEDQVLKKNVTWFLSRLQYLSDVWKAQAADAEMAKMNVAGK